MCFGIAGSTKAEPTPAEKKVLDAVTFYASFNAQPQGDFGGGEKAIWTRSDDPKIAGKKIDMPGYDEKRIRIAPGQGVQGGALEFVEALPRNGYLFFPAAGKLAYQRTGWSGSVSFWLKTDLVTLLKSPYCDPVQITQKTYNDGAFWCDFTNDKPRRLRLGTFPSLAAGQKSTAGAQEEKNIARIKGPRFDLSAWRHVAITWSNYNTGKPNALSILYLDGQPAATLKDRTMSVDWDLRQTRIYVGRGVCGNDG